MLLSSVSVGDSRTCRNVSETVPKASMVQESLPVHGCRAKCSVDVNGCRNRCCSRGTLRKRVEALWLGLGGAHREHIVHRAIADGAFVSY